MIKNSPKDKFEYETPKLVDLQLEQKDTQGIGPCTNGSGNALNCNVGSSASPVCTGGSGVYG